MLKFLIIFCLAVNSAYSQAAQYAQCGGIGWTGATTCVSGNTCTKINDYYYQCLASSGTTTTTTTTKAAATTTKAAATTTKAAATTTRAAATTTAGASKTTQSATTTSTTTTTTTAASGSGNCTGSYTSRASTFINGNFKLGVAYDNMNSASNYDYMTIWLGTIDGSGSTNFNQYYQGDMLNKCKSLGKAAVFYGYVIAYEARVKKGLQDCNMGTPRLCDQGAQFIRDNRAYLVGRYGYHAQNIASYNLTTPIVFNIEPDFWQYASPDNYKNNGYYQSGGPLPFAYARDFYNDIVTAVKTYLPNALISFDISAWMLPADYKAWWSYFKCSKIDFINTSGGQAHGESTLVDTGNQISWAYARQTTGKPIIGDCGYGVGGGASSNCNVWTQSNQNSRISDGVVALSQGSGWVSGLAKPAVTV